MKIDSFYIFDYIAKGIIIANKEGQIIFSNRWINEILEINNHKKNYYLENILPIDLKFIIKKVKESIEKNKLFYLSYALHKSRLYLPFKSKQKIFFNLSIIPFGKENVFIYFDNITYYVNALKKLKGLNEKLKNNILSIKEEKAKYQLLTKLTDIFNEEFIFIKEATEKILKLLKSYFKTGRLTFFFCNKLDKSLRLLAEIGGCKKIKEEFFKIDVNKDNTFSAKLLKKSTLPAFVEDTDKYCNKIPSLKKLKVKSLIFIPLMDFKDDPVGMIHIGFENKRKFSKELRNFVRLISKNIGIGMAKIMLTDELREYSYRMKEKVDEKTKELREIAFLYSTLIENQSEIICKLNPDLKIEFANKSFLKLFKLKKKSAEANNFLSFFNENNQSLILTSLENLTKKVPMEELQLKVKTPSGEKTIVFILKALFKKGKLEGYQVVGRDITRRKRAEEIIKKQKEWIKNSEKLAMLGRISASIVHEINTPVTYIRANSELIEHQLKDLMEKINEENLDKEELINELNELRATSRDIFKGTDRIIGITRGMKAFVKGEVEKSTIYLNELVNEALHLTYQKWYGKVKIKKEIESNTEIFCIKGQMEQVIINLLLNAIDAVRKKGKKEIIIRGWNEDNRAYLKVEDFGEGIPKDNISKIFNPLFSTKNVKEGTGLGLSVVKEIVESHNGVICVDSELNKGTKFKIILPLEEDKNEQIKIDDC